MKETCINVKHYTRLVIFWILGLQIQVHAQVTPDNTLPTNSNVVLQGNTWEITKGTNSGGNLFHSFSDFSIPTGYASYFNNSLQVQNIIVRVTGGANSYINGDVKANGTANLYFLNPNGLIFGSNATLSIGGSFIGSTANKLLFSDGSVLDTTSHTNQSVFTINVPYGLIFDGESGSINVQGAGHSLTAENAVFSPIIGAGFEDSGLRANPGMSIALIGNGINLEGAAINADHITIDSVSKGLVTFSPELIFDTKGVENFNNINIGKKTSIDASGTGSGSIGLNGKEINLNEGSIVLIQNQGLEIGAGINISAQESLNLQGTSEDNFPTRLVTDTLTPSNAGNIIIEAPKVSILNGANIASRTYETGSSGKITIRANSFLEVNGYSNADPNLYSFILTGTASGGRAGNVEIFTKTLNALNGGEIGSGTLDTGNAGNVNIEAEGINVDGSTPSAFGSAIFSISGAKGNSGDVNIRADQTVNVTNGGLISSGTSAEGNAGNTTIVALKSINVSGRNPYFLDGRSQITSDAGTEAVPIIRAFFGLPEQSTGTPGNLTFETPELNIFSGGFVSIGNEGLNADNSYTLSIKSNKIVLNDGFIFSSSFPGGGANIKIDSEDIRLLNGSSITANSGLKEGGNIFISTNTLIALENSIINANSRNDFGGRVTVNAYGVIIDQSSKITATSLLGTQFTGTVEINSPNQNIKPGKTLPIDKARITKLSKPCQSNGLKTQSEYISAGIGGIASNPYDLQTNNSGWGKTRVISF